MLSLQARIAEIEARKAEMNREYGKARKVREEYAEFKKNISSIVNAASTKQRKQ